MNNPNKYRKQERIGRMRDRIDILYKTEATDAYGERVETWATLVTVFGMMQQMTATSNEAIQAGQETVQQETRYTIRYRNDVNETNRVAHNGRTYDIESVTYSNDMQFVTLGCRQIKQA
jgi:SPP1 family predicted phage head-tail adaptor